MTDAGLEFQARAQQILADVMEAEAVTGAKAVSPRGLLRISACAQGEVSLFSRMKRLG